MCYSKQATTYPPTPQRLQNTAEAVKIFDSILSIDKNNFDVLFQKGLCHMDYWAMAIQPGCCGLYGLWEKRNLEEAQHCFNLALSIKEDPDIYYYKCLILIIQGKRDEAYKVIHDSLLKYPMNERLLKIEKEKESILTTTKMLR